MGRPRHRLRFWAMATIAGVFSLLGILLVVLGPDAEARQTGAMCVLFFGLGSVGYLGGPLLTRRGPGKGGWALGACAAVFGLFFLLALYRMARPMRLVITPTRVLVGSSEIRWEAIEDVDLYEMPAGNTTVDMVGIAAKDPAAIRQPRWMALILRVGRNLSAYDLVAGADSFAGRGEEIVEALKIYKRNARRRHAIGSQEELGRLHRLTGLAGRT